MGLFDFFRKKEKEPISSKPSGPLSKKEFARKVLDALQSVSVEGLSYQDSDFSILISQTNHRFFLGNAYDEYLVASDEDAKVRLIARYARQMEAGLPKVPEDWDEVAKSILPLIRSRVFLEGLSVDVITDPEKRIPCQPLGESLAIGIANDTPAAMNYVNVESLGKWGVTYEKAMASALENLLARSTEDFVKVSEGLYRSPWSDCYDCARLLLPEVFKKLKLAGNPVVTAPHWNVLLVADSANANALRELAALTESELDKPRTNHTPAMVLENGGWQRYLPHADHPAYAAILRLNTIAHLQDYADFGPKLQKRLGEHIYVGQASTMSRKTDSKAILTYATWGDGISTLLPKVD